MNSTNAIAIIGMACRFPGARNVHEFWDQLRRGEESITSLRDEELRAANVAENLLRDPRYVKAAPLLDDFDCFDADFFHYSPREAVCIDPQQRVFLECAWEALEDAGYDPRRCPGSVGLFAGAGGILSSYLFAHAVAFHGNVGATGSMTHISNDKDFLTSRISYKLNLRGPSLTIQTACSTSLVAVHLACQSLAAGECDVALAGGVTIRVPHRVGYLYEDGNILSPDGHCRPFDARARGTVFGSGAGIVVLKSLERALADRDHVHALIRGSAVNNDGGDKLSYTASSVEGQARAIVEALAVAGVEPETVGFVEAHGTATFIGDPLEVEALTRAFRVGTARKQFCVLGSVKSNVGHLEAAAGVAGLIKAVLAIEHGCIPATLHFRTPNPRIDFDASPFHVHADSMDWPNGSEPRRACVNSLGIGGTNAHVVVEQAPKLREQESSFAWPAHLLCLSGRNESDLRELAKRHADFLRASPRLPLVDVCFTAGVSRSIMECRLAVICESTSEAAERLERFAEGRSASGFWSGKATDAGLGTLAIPILLSTSQSDREAWLTSLADLAVSYIHGAAIDWDMLYRQYPHQRCGLPTYPFRRRRHWIENLSSPIERRRTGIVARATENLLGVRRHSPSTGETSWQARFDETEIPYLTDHRIFDAMIVPGAAYVSMVLSTSSSGPDVIPPVLENVEFARPLIFSETSSRNVQLVLAPKLAGERGFQVFSQPCEMETDGEWTQHVTGSLVFDLAPTDASKNVIDIGDFRLVGQEIAGADLYRSLHEQGLDLGPAFRNVKRLWRKPGETLAEIEAPESPGVANGLFIHPALLDACFQPAVGLVPMAWPATTGLFIPVQIEKVIFFARPGMKCFCHTRMRSRTVAEAQVLMADLQLLDESGEVFGRVHGLTLRRASRQTLLKNVEAEKRPALVPSGEFQLRISRRGTLENLRLEPVTSPEPGPGEVQIRVRASGLNFRDVLNALGLYPGDPGPLGMECSGIVSRLGTGVERFREGDEVVALAPGSLASIVTTCSSLVIPKPASIDFTEAAMVPVAFVTAFLALVRLAKVRPGERVLIHAAAGGVGLAAIQVARRAGAEVFATASRGKWDYLRSLGINHIMDSRTLVFAPEIMARTNGRGVDVVLNSLAGEFIPASLSVLTEGGRFLEIGKKDIWSAEQVARKRPDISYHIIALDQMMKQMPALAGEALAEVMRLLETNEVQPLPCTIHPVHEALAAFRMMQQARHVGKIVLTMPDASEVKQVSTKEEASHQPRGRVSSLFEQWQRTTIENRQELIAAYLEKQIADLLGLGMGKAPDRASLFDDMGLDSLMTVELRNLLKNELGSTVPMVPTLLFDHPTIEALSLYLSSCGQEPEQSAHRLGAA